MLIKFLKITKCIRHIKIYNQNHLSAGALHRGGQGDNVPLAFLRTGVCPPTFNPNLSISIYISVYMLNKNGDFIWDQKRVDSLDG